MSTLFLTSAASTIGGNFLGSLGKFIGFQVAYRIGTKIDREIIYGTSYSDIVGAEIKELNLQTSVYGKAIPVVFGRVRMSGNVIWASNTKISARESSQRLVNRFDFAPSKIHIDYNQHKSFAIAICEGEIDELISIYANDKVLNMNNINFRLYHGSETQEVDYLIKSIEGNAPGYRGIAYIVIEDFSLDEYGNRLPNFSFEIKRKAKFTNKIRGINIIPGSGEFVYDTKIQFKAYGEYKNNIFIHKGYLERINQNSNCDISDSMLSLNNLQNDFPNLEWISVVIGWFVDSLDIATCSIYPAVEYKSDAISTPDDWYVAGINRLNARKVTLDENSNPIYGGTVSDAALLNFLIELRNRDYKITLYPMLFVDTLNKPWRGNLFGSSDSIDDFFVKYDKFIMHYANLTQGKIDAIVIGSEMKGITSIKSQILEKNTNNSNVYPGVCAFKNLASKVKMVVGKNIFVTYAADWSEYHSLDGEYHMDELWSSPDIDFVGIDAYFPLTDEEEPSDGFSVDVIKNGWKSGEGYEYYYHDTSNRKDKIYYDENNKHYAWKNIKKWWQEQHVNPDGRKTNWKPKMKKIWFTEYGFSSIDGTTNQPNVFIDKTSIESNLPYYSRGTVNFMSQLNAIEGTLSYWENDEMVEKMFLWCWDSRPYPYFPQLSEVWNDGSSWESGHWVQGKITLITLRDILDNLIKRAGMEMKFSANNKLIHGYIIQNKQNIAEAISELQAIYFFDIVEKNDIIHVMPYVRDEIKNITKDDIYIKDNLKFSINCKIPTYLSLIYLSADDDYRIKIQNADYEGIIEKHHSVYVAIVLRDAEAKFIVRTMLYKLWSENIHYKFSLINNENNKNIEPGDIIAYFSSFIDHSSGIELAQTEHHIKVQKIRHGKELSIIGNSILKQNYDPYFIKSAINKIELTKFISETELFLLDLPNLSGDLDEAYLRLAAVNLEEYWLGCNVYVSLDGGNSYKFLTEIYNSATIATSFYALAVGPVGVFDEGSKVKVMIIGNKTLSSVDKLDMLNGSNLLLIGNELIHFSKADFLGNNCYELSCLLRGCYGTEAYIHTHQEMEKCILINDNIKKIEISRSDIGLELIYKAVSIGSTKSSNDINFIYWCISKKPFSVVQIKIDVQSNHDIIVSWNRRSRINSNWLPGLDLPLDEKNEYYEVEILDAKKKSRKRILKAEGKTSVIYKKQDQDRDFVQSTSIELIVYQISSHYGRGMPSEAIQINKPEFIS